MDSTATLSPPTSWVSAAISVVEVTTLSFLAAAPMGKARVLSTRTHTVSTLKRKEWPRLFMFFLERMRSMGAQRKHHLQEQFIRIDITCVARKTVLPTHLAELARPVGQDGGGPSVGQVGKLTAAGTIKASTHEPAAAQLIIARCVEAECALFGG